MVAGESQWLAAPLGSTIGQVRAGRIRGLAVGGSERSSFMPELPTLNEAGVPGYQFYTWNGLMAPAATPRAIIDTLHAAIMKVVKMPDVREQYASAGMEVRSSPSPEDFAKFIAQEQQKCVRSPPTAASAGVAPGAGAGLRAGSSVNLTYFDSVTGHEGRRICRKKLPRRRPSHSASLLRQLRRKHSPGRRSRSASSCPSRPAAARMYWSRTIAPKFSEGLGQQVVMDNRAGAGGMIGVEIAAKSPPDGYTLVLATAGPVAINPSLYAKMPYDPVKDLRRSRWRATFSTC